MKKCIVVSSILLSSMIAPVAAQAGVVGSTAAQFGDFLSSWGRSDSANQPSSVAKTPPLTATGLAGDDCNKQHQLLADQNIADQNAKIDQNKPSSKSIADMPCFDKYKNFSLTGMLGVPSIDSLLAQLKSQACTYADQQVSTATQPVNQSAWLPGGAGRVNTGVVFGGTSTSVNTGVQNSGFSLPTIFK